MYLVLPGVLFLFIFFDLMVFLLNKKKSESKTYFPDFKTWAMGFILGLAIFMFSYFEPLKDALVGKKDTLFEKSEIVMGESIIVLDCRVTSLEVIQQVAVMLFFLAVLGFILAAIVKITRND